jgi:hypothetical protein
LSAAGRYAHQRVQFPRNFGLKSELLCCLGIFVIYLIYFHFIFKNTQFQLAPKKVTNVEKRKRKIIMTTVELKKELITKWEKDTRVSDLAVQYAFYGILLTFQAVISLHYIFHFCFG